MSVNERLSRHRFQDANRNLSEITEEISNLDLENSIFCNFNATMATPEHRPLDTPLLKLYLDTIPPFDGNSLVLHSYIESVRNTFLNFPDDVHHMTHNLILQAVKNKLRGRAQNLIASRTDLITWEGIERLLKLTFGDQRDLQYLTHQLTSMRPNKNERSYDFGLRLQEVRAIIITKINDDFSDKRLRDLQIHNYNNIAKTMFITNLPISVQTIVRMKNPNSLEDALNYVLEEEEFQNFARLHQASYKPHLTTTKNIPTYRNPNQNFGFNQNHNSNFAQSSNQNQNFTPRNFTPPQFTNYNYQPQSQFPSRPINIQPRPVKQYFPTNRQTFGPSIQQNVWKPNQNRNFPKPTPMSGITQTSQQRPKPMSGISYMHNTETTDHVPPYHNERYQYDRDYDNQRYEDFTTFIEAQEEENDEPQYPDVPIFNQQQEQEDQAAANFMNAEPTQYPT